MNDRPEDYYTHEEDMEENSYYEDDCFEWLDGDDCGGYPDDDEMSNFHLEWNRLTDRYFARWSNGERDGYD